MNDLRHTHASFGAAAGLGLPVIGRLLGHKSPATKARYAHLADDPLRVAAERVVGEIAARIFRVAVGEVEGQPRLSAAGRGYRQGGGRRRSEAATRWVAPEGRKSNPLVDWLVRLATLEGALAAAC